MAPRRKAPSADRLAYSITEAAELIGVGKDAVYTWVKAGDLPAAKLNAHFFVLREDLIEFLRQHREVAS